ncbi:MAG: hypothetical protein IT282_00300 [Bacteroidetes bacterium]|nr:hypothetical protein [Bacteroidota bacterium]
MLIAAGVYLILALVCTQIPLLDHPGFEFSFVFAIAGSLVSGMLTMSRVVPRYRTTGEQGEFHAVRVFASNLGLNLALLLLPFGVILLNGFFVPLCDIAEGTLFFILLPVVSVVFSVALGLFCAVHYRRCKKVFLFFAILTFAYAAFISYYAPAIDSYNLFYGYFPGFSYDELLLLDLPLILFRVLTLALAALLVWLTQLIVRNSAPEHGAIRKGWKLLLVIWREYSLPTVIVVALAALLYVFRCEIGWESTAGFIQGRLGSMRETANFVIWYDSTAYRGAEAERMVAEHEFQLARILSAFELPRTGKITSYVYPDAESKRRYVGAGITEFAKPWNREIHITAQGAESVLQHELVHVVAAPFGVPVLNASLSPGLVEGLAVAVEETWGYRTLAQYAAALHRAELAPPIDRMMSVSGFGAQSSAISYVLAGAFCRHLIDRHGMRALLSVYRNGDYEQAYGKPLEDLITEWRGTLDSIAVDDQTLAAVDVFFRRPTIFGKVCARLHARRTREAQQLFEQRRYTEALALFRELASTGGGYAAYAGLMSSLHRQQAYVEATNLYDSLVAHDPHPLRYLPLALTAGDAAWAMGNPIRARSLYGSVRAANVAPWLTEAAGLRLWALEDTATSGEFLAYFLADVPDSARATMLTRSTGGSADTLSWFLRARHYARLKWYDLAAQLLERIGVLSYNPFLETRRRVFLGDMLLRRGMYQEARAQYWSSLNYDASPFAASEIDERIARCEFLERWR